MCKCLAKWWISIGSAVNILVGLVLAGFGVAVQVINSDQFPEEVNKYKTQVFIAFLCVGIFIMLSGIFGIIGSIKEIKCLICMFSVVTAIFCLIVLGIAIGVTVFKGDINDHLKKQETCIDWLGDLDTAYQEAKQYWCKTVGCPCFMSQVHQNEYGSYIDGLDVVDAKNDGVYTDILQCQTVLQENTSLNIEWSKLDDNKSFLKYIEDNFDCTGVCTGGIVYMFSNSDNSPPDGLKTGSTACYQQIRENLSTLMNDMVVPSWIIFGVFLMTTILSFYMMCCAPKNEEDNNNQQEFQMNTVN